LPAASKTVAEGIISGRVVAWVCARAIVAKFVAKKINQTRDAQRRAILPHISQERLAAARIGSELLCFPIRFFVWILPRFTRGMLPRYYTLFLQLQPRGPSAFGAIPLRL
jgi:hypothetical protein